MHTFDKLVFHCLRSDCAQVEMLEFLLNVSRGPLQQLEVSHDDNAHFVLVCCPVANRSAHTWLWHRSTVIMPAAQSPVLNSRIEPPQVLVHLVSALFDLTPSMTTHMPIHLWKRCVGTLFQILNLLKIHPNIVMDEKYDGGEDNRTGVCPVNWGSDYLIECSCHSTLCYVCFCSGACSWRASKTLGQFGS